VKKLSAIKILILKMLKMIVIENILDVIDSLISGEFYIIAKGRNPPVLDIDPGR